MVNTYTSSFAAFYDRYYTGWIRAFAPRLLTYLKRIGTPDTSILDLCCGTGESARVFSEAGWTVIGLDISPGMLALAKTKLASRIEVGAVDIVEGDARAFALARRVGACVCLDGSLNHLGSLSELERCFEAVSAALLDGGQFLFDIYEPSHFRHWHQVAVLETRDAVVIKRGVWDDEGRHGLLRVSGAFGEGPTCLRIAQTLRSRSFTQAEVADALAGTGLALAECDLECTRDGMRPEALDTEPGNRTLYRAVKS